MNFALDLNACIRWPLRHGLCGAQVYVQLGMSYEGSKFGEHNYAHTQWPGGLCAVPNVHTNTNHHLDLAGLPSVVFRFVIVKRGEVRVTVPSRRVFSLAPVF